MHRTPRAFAALFAFAAVLLPLVGCQSNAPAIDRQALYVACRGGEQVLLYEIDPQTGQLTETQRTDLPGPVGPIALTDDGKNLYAALNNPPRILPLQRDTATGKLTALDPTPAPAFPTYLDIDATTRHALAASYGQGIVFSMPLNDDRTVADKPLQITKTQKTAHACLIDPSNRFVYIPHTTPNQTYQFRFDADTGRLSPLDPLVVNGGGQASDPAGPRHYAYHPTLSTIYFVNELDSSVSAYLWDQGTGQLTRFQNLTTLPKAFTSRNTCADIHITPDGKYLYASNRGHDSIAAYRLDELGKMTFIDWFKTEQTPREFAIDKTGRFLYAAGLASHKLAAYEIDPQTGRLSRFATYDTPDHPIWVEPATLD